ncbi:MAG: TerB family tellurite resistance protein [Bacteroidetes bacterium]|nr:TerB family tellurite resistance protein [Bacteroidota bacterium]MDA1345487.1 TerB family tellurite resistance protein [Bacteroidota bacterium]
MSVSDLYTSGFKSRNRDHFAAIVRVALSDAVITESEQAFINRLAIYLEIDDEDYKNIMEDPSRFAINPPADEQRRLERLYDLTRMVYADAIADAEEIKLLKKLVIGLGFSNGLSETIVQKALVAIADGLDEDAFVAALKH